MAWSAARAERRGREWQSARELALERERWAARVADDRGERMLLPDLAVWVQAGATPFGLVAEPGYRRADRQLRILEGWRDAIYSGRYAGVRYDCGDELTARRLTMLGSRVGLDRTVFVAAVQTSPAEISAIELSSSNEEVDLVEDQEPAIDAGPPPIKPKSLPHRVAQLEAETGPVTGPPPMPPNAAVGRARRLRKILGDRLHH